MALDEIGLQLMRLHRQLRVESDPRVKAMIRAWIDDLLDRAQHASPESFAGVSRDKHV